MQVENSTATAVETAGGALAAMVPATAAALALWRCGCGGAGLALELATALVYTAWVAGAGE